MKPIVNEIARVFAVIKGVLANMQNIMPLSINSIKGMFLSRRSSVVKFLRTDFGLSFCVSGAASVIVVSVILANTQTNVSANVSATLSAPIQTGYNVQQEAITLKSEEAPTTLAARAYSLLITPVVFKQKATLKKGEALITLVSRLGVKKSEAYKALHVTKKLLNASSLKPGMLVIATYDDKANKKFNSLTIRDRFDREIHISKDGTDYTAVSRPIPTTPLYALAEGTINSSLYKATSDANVPNAIFGQMIKLFSYDVDFERDIRKGAEYKAYYRQDLADQYQDIDNGPLLYALLKLHNRTVEITRYVDPKGEAHYYTPKGLSIKKALMKTPVDGARLTSSFGRRRHPVLGYTKMHKGLDFGASRGTPIMAAGDGTIERANRYGAYGNYIRIKHFDGLKTAYAHMKKFARGMRKGKRVKQGQIIGYVGTTGRSTGPHLHYEVLKNGKQTNPFKLKIPRGKALTVKEKPLLLGQMEIAQVNMDRIRETRAVLNSIQTASYATGGSTAGK